MTMHRVATNDPSEAAALLQGAALRLIFKHSPTCDVSAMAYTEVSRFADAHPEIDVLVVDVLDQRALSRQIGVELRVAHASPQVLLVVDGASPWNASHRGVTVRAITAALASLPSASA